MHPSAWKGYSQKFAQRKSTVKRAVLRARCVEHDREDETELARVQREQARTPLPGPIPSPPRERARMDGPPEALLRSGRTDPRCRQPGLRDTPRPGHADLLLGGGHDRRRVWSRGPPAGLGRGASKGARPVGRRYLEVVRSGTGLDCVRGSDLLCGGRRGGLPLRVRWVAASRIQHSAWKWNSRKVVCKMVDSP